MHYKDKTPHVNTLNEIRRIIAVHMHTQDISRIRNAAAQRKGHYYFFTFKYITEYQYIYELVV